MKKGLSMLCRDSLQRVFADSIVRNKKSPKVNTLGFFSKSMKESHLSRSIFLVSV
jgi:hypothetical protein